MTLDEFQTIRALIGIDEAMADAARRVLVLDQPHAEVLRNCGADPSVLQNTLDRIRDAELRIRSTFVCHTPGSWEIVVGHHDHHRAPGLVSLNVGDEVRLVCAKVCVMVPVQVTRLPNTPHGYYRGMVLAMEHTSMRYRRGDGVMFSDDQAVLPSGIRRARKPLPV